MIADKAEEAVEKKTFVTGQAADPAQEAENRGWNKKKIKNLYKRVDGERSSTARMESSRNDGNEEGASVEETNRIRASLGLAPLK